jgi:histone arginine demethylase JMJD6
VPELLELADSELALPAGRVAKTAPSAFAETIERRANLSRREFEREYSLPRRPVILTDATKDWAARRWTPELLKERAGHRELEFRGGKGKVRFGDFVDQVAASTDDQPAPYGRNIHVFRDLPELAADIRPRIPCCVPDWKSSCLVPPHLIFENGLEEMFFGGRGTKFPGLHVDYWGMDAFLSQLYGEKEVVVFSPEDSDKLYPTVENPLISSIRDVENPDLERFPRFDHATPIRFTLYPGETLFCPNGWWHTTSMPGVSITIVTANWGRGNWHLLIDQYRQNCKHSSLLKTLIVASYLRWVGAVLTLRDLARGL